MISRLLPAAFYAHPWDMYIWLKSGELGLHDLNIYKFNNPVDYPWGFYAYPPGWLYWLVAVAFIGGSLSFRIFMIKLPIILADLASAIVLYRISRRLGFDESRAMIIMLIWLFNPITYFISSFWGMFDSIAVFFQLLAIYYLLEDRRILSGVMIGFGAAIKILPALLIIPIMVYFWKRGESLRKMFEVILPAAATFLVLSTPFLSTPIEYLQAILQHTKSVGGFTYWMALSTLVNLSNFWFIPLIAFGAIAVLVSRRVSSDKHGLIWSMTLMMAAFLATSPKVNIQHTIFLIPLVLISRELWTLRNTKRNLGLLLLSALVWIICSWFILAGYSPNYIGRLYVSESYEAGLPYVLMAVAGIFGGTRFVALVMDYLNLQKYDTAYISKWNLTVYALVFMIGIAAVFPSPSGVILPNHPIRIAIPESPDSSFIPRSEESVTQFLKHYNITHVVLAFSPDFVNTYKGFEPSRDVTRYFRFRAEPGKWSQSDVKWLISRLKSRGVKVLLGVYLKAEGTIYRYGVQGYSIEWLANNPQLIGYRKVLLFNSTMETDSGKMLYGEYFSKKIEEVLEDFDFDGVYLMSWDDWKIKGDKLKHIMPLLESLRKDVDKPIFIEGPDTLSNGIILELLREADFVVLKTAPLVKQLYYAANDNASLLNYYDYLINVLEKVPEDDRSRLLFTAYTFSFVDGWLNPAIELQLEIRRLGEIGFRSGYAIYYADRYVPYKITVKSG